MSKDLELLLAEENDEGRMQGEARLTKLLNDLISQGRSNDVTLALNDLAARQKFYQEFHIE